MTEIIDETWLLDNLPHGWTYDCTFTPEPAFLIYASEGGAAPRYGPLTLPLRLLASPRPFFDIDRAFVWQSFLRWQSTFDIDRHGPVEGDEWLDWETFLAGGVRGHEAPRCFDCDPVPKET